MEKIDSFSVVGVAIIEKDVQMTSGKNRPLIHYFIVKPDICTQHIDTAMLKIIMRQRAYVDCKIMAVTKLSHQCNGIVGMECLDTFFEKFKFTAMKKKGSKRKDITMLMKFL